MYDRVYEEYDNKKDKIMSFIKRRTRAVPFFA